MIGKQWVILGAVAAAAFVGCDGSIVLPEEETPPGVSFLVTDTLLEIGGSVQSIVRNHSDTTLYYAACSPTWLRWEGDEWKQVESGYGTWPCAAMWYRLEPGDSVVTDQAMEMSFETGTYRMVRPVEWPAESDTPSTTQIFSNGFRVGR